ncbi:MAG: pentapeptide repeat-containing protein, partial [Acidimicrobiales bacterium]
LADQGSWEMADKIALRIERQQHVARILDGLPAATANVVRLKWGLDSNGYELDNKDIAKRVGKSTEWIRLRLREAERHIRHVGLDRTGRRHIKLTPKDIQALLPTRDLGWYILAGANLAGANLAGAYLDRAYLAEANLAGANLDGADLAGANFDRANLDDVNLDRANLTGAHLTGADLTRAYLTGADLTGANLDGAKLAKANLAAADLTDANLAWVKLPDTDLTAAGLTRANLSDADLTDTDLIRADLTETNLTRVKWDPNFPPTWPEDFTPPQNAWPE